MASKRRRTRRTRSGFIIPATPGRGAALTELRRRSGPHRTVRDTPRARARNDAIIDQLT